jgi:hypothetical protein
MSSSAENKEVEILIHRFSESAQATSDMGNEVARQSVVLDYNRVAARFYEDLIVSLRKEVQKYRTQAQFAFRSESTGGDVVFSPGEPCIVSHEFRRKMNRFVEEAEQTPEEL